MHSHNIPPKLTTILKLNELMLRSFMRFVCHFHFPSRQLIVLVALVAVAAADRRPYSYSPPQYSSGSDSESYESSEAKYDFDWAVSEDSNEFAHQEARDGDDTRGSYYVQLPDGRLQTVTYYVDGDNGYVAEVNYEGEAHYDSVESGSSESREYSAPRPSYSAPRPVYG